MPFDCCASRSLTQRQSLVLRTLDRLELIHMGGGAAAREQLDSLQVGVPVAPPTTPPEQTSALVTCSLGFAICRPDCAKGHSYSSHPYASRAAARNGS